MNYYYCSSFSQPASLKSYCKCLALACSRLGSLLEVSDLATIVHQLAMQDASQCVQASNTKHLFLEAV